MQKNYPDILKQWIGETRIDVARIEIQNQGTSENDVQISVTNDAECKIDSSDSKNGKIYHLNSTSRSVTFDIVCVKNGLLKVSLQGIQLIINGEKLTIIPDYVNFIANGTEILSTAKPDSPKNTSVVKNVVDGEILKIEVSWNPHVFTNNDLGKIGDEQFMEISCLPSQLQLPKVGFKKSIEFFENGAEYIYILDDDGIYDWWAIWNGNQKLSFDSEGVMQLAMSYLPPISLKSSMDKIDDVDLFKLCKTEFEKNPKSIELPIIDTEGKIVARVKKISKNADESLDWSKLSTVNLNWLNGKIYVASDSGIKLHGLFDFLKRCGSDVEIISNENIKEIFQDKKGTLIYGKDLYPDIPKMSADQLYQKVVSLKKQYADYLSMLRNYEGFHADLSHMEFPTDKFELPIKSCMKEFLAQIESDLPVILKDAYDIEELTWICDKLRTTDRFNSDNHLYLQYSSLKDFLKSMTVIDWTYVIGTKKVVFLFSDEEKSKYYPTKIERKDPKPLAIDEINEFVNSIPRSFSGSDFFNMILDSHPSLLTIGWHGLSSFVLVWKIFCEGKSVKDAIDRMSNPINEDEIKLLDVNLNNALKYKHRNDKKAFFKSIPNYLDPNKQYGLCDWFKAFFLSVNEVVGRKFNQRIAPAVFWDRHGEHQETFAKKFSVDFRDTFKMEQTVSDGFKHHKRIGVVRSPFTNFGCVYGRSIEKSSNPLPAFIMIKRFIQGYEYWCFEKFYGRYLKFDDPNFEIMRQVRFEDLKLYPRETIEKVCEFLRIPWSETCLHITTNGEDSGRVDGTAGFDVRPVFNPHSEHMSSFDFYRIELLNYQNYSVWGYKPKFYDGMKYTREELEKLYAIPFKIETQKFEKYPDWPNEKESKEFHEWILARAIDVMENGERQPIDSDGKPMRLVECLFPDLKPGQRLFEC